MEIVDWCYCVVDRMKLKRETVATSMDLTDRFLSTSRDSARIMLQDRVDYQLLAMTALYVAIKSFEHAAIGSEAFAEMSQGTYTVEEIEATERELLGGLSWRICAPTAVQIANYVLSVVAREVNIAQSAWDLILDEAQYQTECAVRDYRLSIMRPSTVAMASIFNALDQVSQRDRRAILRALLLGLNDEFDPPEDLLSARDDLRDLVQGTAIPDNESLACDETAYMYDLVIQFPHGRYEPCIFELYLITLRQGLRLRAATSSIATNIANDDSK